MTLATSRIARPIAPVGTSIGWWGAVLGLIAVGHLVAAAWVAAIYLRSRVATWPPTATSPPDLGLNVGAVAAIGLAAGLAVVAARGLARAKPFAVPLVALAAVLGFVATGLRAWGTVLSDHPIVADAYWSVRWFLGALDTVLLVTATLVLGGVLLHSLRKVIVPGRSDELGVAALWVAGSAVFVTGTLIVQLAISVWWG
jgi:hypothetical protein